MNRTQLLHYLVTAKLGEGGMGEVYRATDTKLGREVAIKVLPTTVSRHPQSVVRLEREARALAALNHPNIASIYGFEMDQGTHFLVLELVEGETLAERLRRGSLSVKESLTVARQIAEAIQEAHEKGVIHRDLKPGNVKITPNGRVKVLDFGLAKLEQTVRGAENANGTPAANPDAPTILADSTVPGTILGTPAYMSPEQARGQEVDKRTDIWAFGCCLYECLTGQRPFKGATASDLMAEVLKSDPDWTQVPAETPSSVVTLLRRCLEKEPSRRLSSIGDIAITLDESTRGTSAALTLQTPQIHSSPNSVPRSNESFRRWVRPVFAGFLILVFGSVWILWQRYGSSHQDHSVTKVKRITSLAVKPLDDYSGNTNNAYLSDGMTEALCAALGNLSALRVPGRSSVMRYKGGQKSIQEMAKELNVEAIVEGSVQRTTTNMLVTVQLIEADTDRHLWATNYRRDLSDFFVVQSELARAIADEVQARLTPEDQTRLARAHPANPDAIEACLLGMHHYWKFTDESFTNALRYFQKAAEIDPNYAPAHAGAALAYGGAAGIWLWPAREAMPKSKAAALRAIELDPTLSDAYVALAIVKMLYDWDWPGAERDYKRAIELSPSSQLALDAYAGFLSARSRFNEAIAIQKRAVEMDPLSPALNTDLSWAYYFSGQFERAVSNLRRALELDRNFFQAHYLLGWNYQLMGKKTEALVEFQTAVEIDPDSPQGRMGLVYAFGMMGRNNDALKVLAELEVLSNKRHITSLVKANASLGLGQKDVAIDWLEKTYAERDIEMAYLGIDPSFAALRNEPRFQVLVKKVEDGGREK